MIALYRYRLPFRRLFHAAGRFWSVREGVLIRFSDSDHDVTAEAAPLPGFSAESTTEVEQLLLRERDRLNHLLERVTSQRDLDSDLEFSTWPPSVRFAVSTLAMELIQERNPEDLLSLPVQTNRLTAHTFRERTQHPEEGTQDPVGEAQESGVQKDRKSGDQTARTQGDTGKRSGDQKAPKHGESTRDHGDKTPNTLQINAVIGLESPETRFSETLKLYEEGYRTIKYKCGPEPGPLPALLEKVAARLPELTLRIDVNRSWPAEKTPDYLNRFAALPVEYVEEPCRFNGLEAFNRVREQSPLPLALDESITSRQQLRQIISSGRVDAVILKPTLLGSLFDIMEDITATSDGERSPVKRVFTTTLESAVARRTISRLAILAGSPDTAHGLDTGRLFGEDLIRSDLTGSDLIRSDLTGSDLTESDLTGSDLTGSDPVGGSIHLPDSGNWCTPFSDCRQEFLENLSAS